MARLLSARRSAVQVSLLELTEPPATVLSSQPVLQVPLEPESLAQGFPGLMLPAPAIPGRWSLQVPGQLRVVQNLQKEPESAPRHYPQS